MVRTTGWLQIGALPISSGVWPALACSLLALPFDVPWLPFPFAAGGFSVWKVWILYVQPSSRAVNLDSTAVSALAPGEWFRPYGSIGPAAEVAATRLEPDGWQHIALTGGRELTLAPEYRVRRVRLRS
jgi:hypothetical protein